jgi:hypothetical protein
MVFIGLFSHTILLLQPGDIGNRAIMVQEI